MPVAQAPPALGHMMLPPRTANRHTPACGGMRFDPVQRLFAMPFIREFGSDA
jgi:hypothetical protein